MNGSKASGTVLFAKGSHGKLWVRANVINATPGNHGLDIDTGTCSSANIATAVFNPTHEPHASPTQTEHQAGEIGNLTVVPDRTGMMEAQVQVQGKTPFTDWNQIIGNSVVLHIKADDFSTQPDGNAGIMVACGEITETQESTAH